MNNKIIILISFLFLPLFVICDYKNLYPFPYSMTYGNETSILSNNFNFNVDSHCYSTTSPSSFISNAFERYLSYLFWNGKYKLSSNNQKEENNNINILYRLDVCIMEPIDINANFNLNTSEEYNLSIKVNSDYANLYVYNIFGMLKGLETFVQLFNPIFQYPTLYNPVFKGYEVTGLPIQILDKPRFAWRGLMIDTARHYLPVSIIYKIIDIMSFTKFNSLHWHISDSQSIPFQSKIHPFLIEGAWDPSLVYTISDISSIVEYARTRGIRIIPEIDLPAHCKAIAKGYPSILAYCPDHSPTMTPIGDLKFFEDLLDELSALFPDEYFHLGGDEVSTKCWEQDTDVNTWMINKNITIDQIYGDIFHRLIGFLKDVNKTIIAWDEILGAPEVLDKNHVVIEAWRDNPKDVVALGYPVLSAHGNYLDRMCPTNVVHYSFEEGTWEEFYNNDPLKNISSELTHLVLGGEACMWAEQVNQFNVIQRIFPRAFGVSENLWTKKEHLDATTALPRVNYFSCVLSRRGFGIGAIQPSFCLLPSQQPNSNPSSSSSNDDILPWKVATIGTSCLTLLCAIIIAYLIIISRRRDHHKPIIAPDSNYKKIDGSNWNYTTNS